MPGTYHTRIETLTPEGSSLLDAYASLYSEAERSLFADFCRGKRLTEEKSRYLREYGITARQFNAIRINLQGKIASVKERRKGLIKEKKRKNQKARETLKALREETPQDRRSRD